jgi:hypothetical protein
VEHKLEAKCYKLQVAIVEEDVLWPVSLLVHGKAKRVQRENQSEVS